MANFVERFGATLPDDPLERERFIMALRAGGRAPGRIVRDPKKAKGFAPIGGADWEVTEGNFVPPEGWQDEPTGPAAEAPWERETDYLADGRVPTPRPRPQLPAEVAGARNQASEGDLWEQFKASQQAKKAPSQPSAPGSSPFDEAGFASADFKIPQIGAVEAFTSGIESGGSLGWGEELRGVQKASGIKPGIVEQLAAKWLPEGAQPAARAVNRLVEGPVPSLVRTGVGAVRKLAGDKGAEDTYTKSVEADRERARFTKDQQYWPQVAGEVAGGVATPMPALAAGARLLPYAGKLAGISGLYGATQAAGEAEGTPTALGTGVGGAISAAMGGALPIVGRGAHWLTAKPLNYLRNTWNAPAGAERAVATAARENARIGRQTGIVDELTPQQMLANPEARLMDTLGEPGRQLARSASNMDPESHGLLQNTLRDRAADRPTRAVAEIDQVRGNAPSAAQLRENIRQEGIDTSDPLYEFARRQGNRDLSAGVAGAQGLPRLLERSPALRRAATEAEASLQDIYAGREQAWPGVRNLEYWDQVKRQLDQQINTAETRGQTADVGRLTSVKNALVERLDTQVPGYADARANSEAFFGAGDAVRSGQQLHGRTQDIGQHIDSIRNLRPADRRLASQGLTDRVRQQASTDPNFWGKFDRDVGAVRTKLQGVLEPGEFSRLEARSFLERIMQASHHAVSGNSSTVRQLAQRGLSGVAGAGLGYSASGEDQIGQVLAGGGGALTAGNVGGVLMAMQDRRMARLISRALLSNDQALMDRVSDYVARDKNVMNYLRQATNRIGGVGSRMATPAATDDEER